MNGAIVCWYYHHKKFHGLMITVEPYEGPPGQIYVYVTT